MSARIGVVGPFSGLRSAWGEALRRSAAAAAQACPEVDWLIRDDAGDESAAAGIAENLVAEGVCAVVGHYASYGALRALSHYEQAGVTLIAPASSHPEIARRGRSVLRLCADDDAQAELIATASPAAICPERVRILHDGTRYGIGLAHRLSRHLDSDMLQVVGWTAADCLAAADGACVVYAGAHHEAARVARELSGAGFSGAFVCTDDSHIHDFCIRGGASVDGAVVVRSVPSFADTTRLAFELLRRALRRQHATPSDDLHALLSRGCPGVEFDPHGNNTRAYWKLSRVVEGRFRDLVPA
jgi:ABC-type branched-subunit amino acid transport system substrate-binding protein